MVELSVENVAPEKNFLESCQFKRIINIFTMEILELPQAIIAALF